MKLHIVTKIRIGIIIVIAAGLYWLACKGTLYNNNGYPQTIWGNPNSSILKYLYINIICITATILAFFLGGKNARYIAPLAAPFTLLLPAIFSPDMRKFLINYQTGSTRADMFFDLAIDVVLWYIPIMTGLMVVVLLNKRFIPKIITPESGLESNKTKFGTDISKCIMSTAAASIIAIIILPYLCMGDSAELLIAGTPQNFSTVASIGQQAFAVTATFFIAVMATHQFLGTTGKAFIPIPIIVAIFFYIKGNNSLWDEFASNGVPPHLIHPGLTTLTILPITYAVFGSFGIAWGYWNSYKLHYARENNLIHLK